MSSNWTLDNFKTLLGIPLGDTSQDVAVQQVMDSALSFAETFLGRKIFHQEYVENFYYPNRSLLLKAYPVDEITDVNGGAMPSDWVLRKRYGIADISYASSQEDELAVTYTGGMEPIPDDLYRALQEAFLALWGASDGTTGLPDAETGGQVISGAREESRITIADFGSITYDDASQYASNPSALTAESQMKYGWMAPWAATLDMYRSEHGAGVGIA